MLAYGHGSGRPSAVSWRWISLAVRMFRSSCLGGLDCWCCGQTCAGGIPIRADGSYVKYRVGSQYLLDRHSTVHGGEGVILAQKLNKRTKSGHLLGRQRCQAIVGLILHRVILKGRSGYFRKKKKIIQRRGSQGGQVLILSLTSKQAKGLLP